MQELLLGHYLRLREEICKYILFKIKASWSYMVFTVTTTTGAAFATSQQRSKVIGDWCLPSGSDFQFVPRNNQYVGCQFKIYKDSLWLLSLPHTTYTHTHNFTDLRWKRKNMHSFNTPLEQPLNNFPRDMDYKIYQKANIHHEDLWRIIALLPKS